MLVNKKKDMTPYDMARKPCRQNPLLLPLIWTASFFATRSGRLKLEKIGIKGLKPPYLVLSQHQGFADYYIAPLYVFPHRANYISDVEGFAAFGNWLYRNIGCVAKRRFTHDISLIRNIQHIVKINKDILFVFPEARHSNVGTGSKLPVSTGKLVKMLGIPVVVLKLYGSYLTAPVWDEAHKRKAPLRAVSEKVLETAEINGMTVEEITTQLDRHFTYDEYRWQYENRIHISYSKRAEGLHKVLYMCPHCLTEYWIRSKNNTLFCRECRKQWEMDELGQLTAVEGETEFSHIPDWYEFQRKAVEKEIRNGKYFLKETVDVEALPNEKGFVSLGSGLLKHTEAGFSLSIHDSGEHFVFPSRIMNSVHTEYNYKGNGEAIILSTKDCCYYLYPESDQFNVTKIQFAAEFFYEQAHKPTLPAKT